MEKGNILVVDDEDLMREVVGEMLENEGYTVNTAKNKEEAKQIVKNIELTLIISDCYIKQERGTDLYIELKEEKIYPHIDEGFFVMSGQMKNDYELNKILDNLEIDPSRRFPKPLDRKTLVAKVDNYHKNLFSRSN